MEPRALHEPTRPTEHPASMEEMFSGATIGIPHGTHHRMSGEFFQSPMGGPRRRWVVPLILVVVLALIVGTVVLFQIGTLRLPSWIPVENGDALFKKALAASRIPRMTTSTTTLSLKLEKREDAVNPFDVEAGSLLATLPDDFHLTSTIQTNEGATTTGKNLTEWTVAGTYKAGDTAYDAMFIFRREGDVLYLKIQEFPELPLINFAPVKDQWIVLESGVLGSFFITGIGEEDVHVNEQIFVALEAAYDAGALHVETKGRSSVEGNRTRQLHVTFDPAKLQEAYTVIATKLRENFGDNAIFHYDDAAFTDPQVQAATTAIAEHASFDFWIIPETGEIQKNTFSLNFAPTTAAIPENRQFAFTQTTTVRGADATTLFEPTIATYTSDQAVALIAQGGSFLNPDAENSDADNDGALDSVEKAFGTDPNNPDTDGDGFLDWIEIQNGFNPLGLGKQGETGAP